METLLIGYNAGNLFGYRKINIHTALSRKKLKLVAVKYKTIVLYVASALGNKKFL